MQGFRGFVFCVLTVASVVPALAQASNNNQSGQGSLTQNNDSSYTSVGLPKSNDCANMTKEQCEAAKAAAQANDQP